MSCKLNLMNIKRLVKNESALSLSVANLELQPFRKKACIPKILRIAEGINRILVNNSKGEKRDFVR